MTCGHWGHVTVHLPGLVGKLVVSGLGVVGFADNILGALVLWAGLTWVGGAGLLILP